MSSFKLRLQLPRSFQLQKKNNAHGVKGRCCF